MLYQAQAIMHTAKKSKTFTTGWWQTSNLALMELGGLLYKKIPTRVSWDLSLNMKSKIGNDEY